MGKTSVVALMACALLAPLLLSQGLPRTIEVSGRVAVEPAYPTPFPQELTLTFEAAGRSGGVSLYTVSENVKTTNFRATRGGMTGDVRLQKDGKFLVLLPRLGSEFRLIVRNRPGATAAASDRYFVKSAAIGDVNLMERPLLVASPFNGEIVITLAKCTEQTLNECL